MFYLSNDYTYITEVIEFSVSTTEWPEVTPKLNKSHFWALCRSDLPNSLPISESNSNFAVLKFFNLELKLFSSTLLRQ